MSKSIKLLLLSLAVVSVSGAVLAQAIKGKTPATWLTVTEQAAGTNQKAKDQAIAKALRRAVEEGCGVFLKAHSKTKNYQGVYDKVFADAVGYVKEHEVLKTWIEDDCYHAKVRALVSTQKFEKDWSAIAHTYHQEQNPRVIIVIGQTGYEMMNQLEIEAKSSSAQVAQIQAESRRRTAAAAAGASGQDTDAARVSGRFSRFRGRVRPRNWAVMSTSRRRAWERRVIAEQAQAATVTAAAAASRKANLKIWKQVATTIKDKGEVQGIIENFFLEKGIKLMDQAAVKKTNKRDLMLASADDDLAAVAALGAKFNADVIILGTAAAKPGNEITVAGVTMYKYPTKLVVRVIRTDSGQLMASKVYSETKTSTLKSGGETKALDKLARQSAPKLLAAVVEAWRKQVNVTRDINLQIAGMTFAEWKTFRKTVEALRGVKALRLREITAGVANIDAEYEFTTQSLADEMTELKTPKLEVTEFNPNRLKLKVVK